MLKLEPSKTDADALELRKLLDDYLAGHVEAVFVAARDRHGVVRYTSIGNMITIQSYEHDRLHRLQEGD